MDTFLATLFLIVCVLLMVVVLLQRGRGGGLGGAFGGTGHSAFGTRTGDVFTWVTIVLVGVFLLLAIATSIRFRPRQTTPVDMPTFYPLPKPIEKRAPVTIQCKTPGAKVYYTLGTKIQPPPTPTRRDFYYEMSAVMVEPGTVLKARAFLTGWPSSDVAEGYYPHPSEVEPATGPAQTLPAEATRPATATRPGG